MQESIDKSKTARGLSKRKNTKGLRPRRESNYPINGWDSFDSEIEQLKVKFSVDTAKDAIRQAMKFALNNA